MKVNRNISMRDFSYWKIGGNASYQIDISNQQDYIEAVELLSNINLEPIIVGKTSNLLFSDEDLDIGLIRLSGDFEKVTLDKDVISIGAAASCQKLVRFGHENGLVGIEHIVGIPATIGGLVYMNGGSRRETISSNVISVTSVTPQGVVITRSKEECLFNYRKSIFQHNNELISSVEIQLEKGCVKKSRLLCLDILKDRRTKFPRKQPSCGSVFISHPDMYKLYGPPGKIIEQLGLKGKRIGDAEISLLHANFIVNTGEAKSNNVLELVQMIEDSAVNKYGVVLESEGIYIDKYGKKNPLHVAAKKLKRST